MEYIEGLSSRQKSLINELQILQNRLLEPLPIIVSEVIGFGSFFRGKQNPKDIDLTLNYSSINPIYLLFENMITKQIIDLYHIENHLTTPKDALIKLFNKYSESNISNKYLKIYSNWLENVSWNELENKYLTKIYNKEKLTQKILQRNLSHIKIALPFNAVEIDDKDNEKIVRSSSFLSKHYSIIWTKDNQDIVANILKNFKSPQKISNACLIELENVERELSPLKYRVEIFSKLLYPLKKLANQANTFEINKWIYQETLNRRIIPFLTPEETRTLVDYDSFNFFRLNETIKEKLTQNFDISKYFNTDNEELEKIIKVKRKRIKNLKKELYVLEHIISLISHWYESLNDNSKWSRTNYDFELYISFFTLQKVRKDIVKDTEIRKILREYDLPENKVETIKIKGERTFYRVRD